MKAFVAAAVVVILGSLAYLLLLDDGGDPVVAGHAQTFVKGQLRSPSTATFKPDSAVPWEGWEDRWTATGQVTSRGRDGGMVTSTYEVNLQRVCDNVKVAACWHPLKVKLNQFILVRNKPK